MTIEIIDKHGVGWRNGKRIRQYPEYQTEKLPKTMRNLIKGCDVRYDPEYWQNGSTMEGHESTRIDRS